MIPADTQENSRAGREAGVFLARNRRPRARLGCIGEKRSNEVLSLGGVQTDGKHSILMASFLLDEGRGDVAEAEET